MNQPRQLRFENRYAWSLTPFTQSNEVYMSLKLHHVGSEWPAPGVQITTNSDGELYVLRMKEDYLMQLIEDLQRLLVKVREERTSGYRG
jgi:hypothetical protein